MANSIHAGTDATKGIVKSAKSASSPEALFIAADDLTFEQLLSSQFLSQKSEETPLNIAEKEIHFTEESAQNISQSDLIDALQLGFKDIDAPKPNIDAGFQAEINSQSLAATVLAPITNLNNSADYLTHSDVSSMPSNVNAIAPASKIDISASANDTLSTSAVTSTVETPSAINTTYISGEKTNSPSDFSNLFKQNSKTYASSKESLIHDVITHGSEPQKVSYDTLINKSSEVTLASGPIAEYPGKAGWNEAIGQRVIMMTHRAEQSATLILNPPEMGQLDIVIEVNNNQADASFLSDRQEVRQALQDGIDNLRQMMKEAGITLGNTNIGERDSQKSHTSAKTPLEKQPSETQQQETPDLNKSIRTIGVVDTYV